MEIKTLIDCGASKTIATKELMDRLGYQIDAPSSSTFALANGISQSLLGVVYDVPINAGGGLVVPCTVEVLPKALISLLIGTNWLTRANAVINFPRRIMKMQYKRQPAEVPIHFIKKNHTTTVALGNKNTTQNQVTIDSTDEETEEEYDSESTEDSSSDEDNLMYAEERTIETHEELFMAEKDEQDSTLTLTSKDDSYKVSISTAPILLQAHTQKSFFVERPETWSSEKVYDLELTHPELIKFAEHYHHYQYQFKITEDHFQISFINNSDEDVTLDSTFPLAIIHYYDAQMIISWDTN